MPDVRVTIVGGGAVGCATAYQLSQRNVSPVVVIEQNPSIPGDNQSSRNSGVVHAGIYYWKHIEPLKADLCVRGNTQLYSFCQQYKVPCAQTGKLVVATTVNEEERLEDLLNNARRNDVPNLRMLSSRDAAALEPGVRARSALFVPTSGIIDQATYVAALRTLAEEQGVLFRTSTRVNRINVDSNKITVETTQPTGSDDFTTECLINAAGLYADRVARLTHPNEPIETVTVRGEYASFSYARNPSLIVRRNIYPLPHYYLKATGDTVECEMRMLEELVCRGLVARSLGIHLTPTFDDKGFLSTTILVGPAKVTGVERDTLVSSLDTHTFYRSIVSFFPSISADDLRLHYVGNMASGGQDWRILKKDRCVHLLGLGTPGLTASLAVGEYLCEQIAS